MVGARTDDLGQARNNAAALGVRSRCGGAFGSVRCRSPSSGARMKMPRPTCVKGGTYYGFQPGNGPAEYAAELAIRHFREQRAILRGEKLRPRRRFKCLAKENAQAWRLFVDEFFEGRDLVPACP